MSKSYRDNITSEIIEQWKNWYQNAFGIEIQKEGTQDNIYYLFNESQNRRVSEIYMWQHLPYVKFWYYDPDIQTGIKLEFDNVSGFCVFLEKPFYRIDELDALMIRWFNERLQQEGKIEKQKNGAAMINSETKDYLRIVFCEYSITGDNVVFKFRNSKVGEIKMLFDDTKQLMKWFEYQLHEIKNFPDLKRIANDIL